MVWGFHLTEIQFEFETKPPKRLATKETMKMQSPKLLKSHIWHSTLLEGANRAVEFMWKRKRIFLLVKQDKDRKLNTPFGAKHAVVSTGFQIRSTGLLFQRVLEL